MLTWAELTWAGQQIENSELSRAGSAHPTRAKTRTESQFVSPLEYYQTKLQDALIEWSEHPVTKFGNILEVHYAPENFKVWS